MLTAMKRVLVRAAAYLAAFALLSVGLRRLWLHAVANELNQDEFQHVHIAWSMLQGQLPYRDFFDHHGPVTGWLGVLVLYLRGAEAASFDTFLVIRRLNLVWVIGQTCLVAWLGRRVSSSWLAGAAAAGLFTASSMLQFVGVQYRPDALQNLLMLAGLALVLSGRDRWAGAALGLMLGVNPKALLPLGAVIAGLVVATAVESRRSAGPRLHFRRSRRLAAGFSWATGAVLGLLFLQGAAAAYFREAWGGSVALAAADASSDIAALSRERLIEQDAWLLVVLGVAAAAALVRLRSGGRLFDVVLLTTGGAVMLLVLWLPLRSYAFLMPLPVLCVVAGAGGRPTPTGASWPAWLLMAGPLAVLLHQAPAPQMPDPSWTVQQRTLEEVLERPRDEAVAYLWPSRCGAYVFNAHPDFDWLPTGTGLYHASFPRSQDAFESIVRGRLLRGAFRHLVAEPAVVDALPPDVLAYLNRHFRRQECLLTRLDP
ncbi:MAG: hypothetical protein RL199_524 [Pseudomonadota bacterium]|jgi:hypothetical protein